MRSPRPEVVTPLVMTREDVLAVYAQGPDAVVALVLALVGAGVRAGSVLGGLLELWLFMAVLGALGLQRAYALDERREHLRKQREHRVRAVGH